MRQSEYSFYSIYPVDDRLKRVDCLKVNCDLYTVSSVDIRGGDCNFYVLL